MSSMLEMDSDLFSTRSPAYEPLASRLRPTQLEHYVGQSDVVGEGTALRHALDRKQLHSMILWGPPGVGKTTLARLVAHYVDADFITLSAVMSGVKEIREAVEQARFNRHSGRSTILFIDEVHRFNKSQQDAFLPHVEDGTFIFIGATTENPSFELNNALLSRARVYRLTALSEEDLLALLTSSLQRLNEQGGWEGQTVIADSEALQRLAQLADGDARRVLNHLEFLLQSSDSATVSLQTVEQWLSRSERRFDKGGDLFYEQISALHKSVRGSDPDAALYWMVRMLDGGCDPLYIARRVVRMASEDIGNADPRALELSLNAWDVQERLGSPEGELAIAQAVVYLACAPKSNAVYSAFKKMKALVASQPGYEVPNHLRNAPTKLMKSMDYGQEYRYAHDEPEAFAAGECYFPEELGEQRFYQPVSRGLEDKISRKLAHLQSLNATSERQRYDRAAPVGDEE